MIPLHVFIGMDARQPMAYNVCASSVLRHAKRRVTVEPININWIPGFTRTGLTQFTFARYMVPWLCNYQGTAIFMDGDIIVRGDVNDLAALSDQYAPVSVAQHMARFEWPSVMVFNNWRCHGLTLDFVNSPETKPSKLEWSKPLGLLPPEWNHCVLYDAHMEDAKLIHFTAGLPCWPETRNSPHAEKWFEEYRYMNSTVSWQDLMGQSVHVEKVRQLNRGAF